MQLVLKKSDDDRCEKGQGKRRPHIFLIDNPVHGTVADDKVAHDAAAESRDENDDENAYRIDFFAFDGKKAGKSKGNDPDGIGKSQETGLHDPMIGKDNAVVLAGPNHCVDMDLMFVWRFCPVC